MLHFNKIEEKTTRKLDTDWHSLSENKMNYKAHNEEF